jgi:hypothetical protein
MASFDLSNILKAQQEAFISYDEAKALVRKALGLSDEAEAPKAKSKKAEQAAD